MQRLLRLLLVLAAGIGAADAYCGCPEDAVTCGVGDLVLVPHPGQGEFGSDTITATSCVPDVATGHLEADIYVRQNNAALASLDLSALASVGGSIYVRQNNDALASLDLPVLASVGGYLYVAFNDALASLDLPALASVGSFLDVNTNVALVSLDLPALASVGGYLYVNNNAALASLDLPRLAPAGVAFTFTVASNAAAIVTTLPCAAKAIPKIDPSGAVTYWNEHPTVCHAGSATVGDDGTCGECSDYVGGGACGRGVSACVSCNVAGAPTPLPGFVRFVGNAAQPGGSIAHVYPCSGGACAETVCRCPPNQAVCDFATDLLDAAGQAGTSTCSPDAEGSLDADIYIYGNDIVESITLGSIVSTGSLTAVACPELVSIEGPSLETLHGNLTIQSCGNLAAVRLASTASVHGFAQIEACESLIDLEVPMLETVGGDLTLSNCASLRGISARSLSLVAGDLTLSNCASLRGISARSLSLVAGDLRVNNAPLLARINLPQLGTVASSFSIAGISAAAMTSLPCSAMSKPWESSSVGAVEYLPSTPIVCHVGSSVVQGSCDVCDVCVSCDDEDSATGDSAAPVVLPHLVRFVGKAEAAHIFKCESESGCHGNADTGAPAACHDHYEGHLCQSCASGFFTHEISDEEGYECKECEAADMFASVLALLVAAAVFVAGNIALWRLKQSLGKAELEVIQAVIRSVWLPIRTMITYAQINSQLGSVLNVRFPEMLINIVRWFGNMLNVVDILIGSECIGLGSFLTKWLKDIILLPAIMLGVVGGIYLYECKTSEAAARDNVAGNAFFVLFFCYPTLCNTLFASFICTTAFDGQSILAADDRVLCEDTGHVILQGFSYFFIAVVACGVPVGATFVLVDAHRRRPDIDEALIHRVARDLKKDLRTAEQLIRDIKFGSEYGFLVKKYRSNMFMWEAVDMVRKLFLVGLVLMFGRGTTLQLLTTSFVATLFMLAHTLCLPYKLSRDNLLRGSTELHTLFTILLAVMLKTDGDDESSRAVYDVLAVATFVGLVALPFVVIVGLQLREIQTLMQEHLDLLRSREADSAAASTTAVDLGMAIRRHELGLQSSADRQTVLEYFDDPSAGMEVWKDKTIVSHLTADELQARLEEEEAQLPKSQSFGLHFTDLDSARLILTSLGIRASTVGQLNGGVSICLESMAGLGWSRHGGRDFAENVGKKLWGSKWYEVMGGDPWPDLEHRIASGRVKGSWPAARDEWGSWAKKLEAVFVVRIPSEGYLAPDRFVPGRKDVYILPPQDCIKQGDFYFYTNDHIAHCFILKPPSDKAGRKALDGFAQRDEPVRVLYSSSRDGGIGMQGVTMAELRKNVAAADVEVVDDSSGFPPKVLSCVAAVAQPPDAGDTLLTFHRKIETQREGRQLWEEDVARFTDEEMAAALRAMDQTIPRRYSLTYYFTTKEIAQGICAAGGGLVAADDPIGDRIVVSTRSPVELGWVKNGGSRFQASVGQLLWQAAPADIKPDGRYAGRLQVMLIVAVPTAVLEDARNQHQRAGLVAIPAELLTDAGIYSNAHISKCYALGQGAQLRNAVGAVVALNNMVTFGGARSEPSSDVEVGSDANVELGSALNAPSVPESPDAATTAPARPPGRGLLAQALTADHSESAAPSSETPAATLFDRVDTDGSGLISFDEFASWWSRKQLAIGNVLDKHLAAKVQHQWAELDTDGSGDLDRSEFVALMTQLATSEWKEAFDSRRDQFYYYNCKTKETRWDQPDEEEAVAAFIEANGLTASKLMRKPPALDTLQRPHVTAGGSDSRTATTENPMSQASFDVETPQRRQRSVTKMRAASHLMLASQRPTPDTSPAMPRRSAPSLPSRTSTAVPSRPAPRLPSRSPPPL